MDSDPMDVDLHQPTWNFGAPGTPPADTEAQADEKPRHNAAAFSNDMNWTTEQNLGYVPELAQAPTPSDTDLHVDGEPEGDQSADVDNSHPRAATPMGIPEHIPDLTEGKMFQLPEIRARFDAYRYGWSDPTADYDSHMKRAKDLAYVLLRHYFPESQGFSVEEEGFDLMAKYGYSFEFDEKKTRQASNGEQLVKSKRNKKKKRGSNAKQAVVEAEESDSSDSLEEGEGIVNGRYAYMPKVYNSWPSYHHIPRERIAGFVVYKAYHMNHGGYENFPHTYLAIMIDDLLSRPLWAPASKVDLFYPELMTTSYVVDAKIREGYAIMILGNNIEFYKFKNGSGKVMTHLFKDNWAFKLTDGPGLLNETFAEVAGRQVFYENGIIGTGSSKYGKAKAKEE